MRGLYTIWFLLSAFVASAQRQSMLFEKSWGNYYYNEISYADELPNGDYVLFGQIRLYPLSQPQFYMCRMDAKGNRLWEKNWGNTGEPDFLQKTIKCKDGCYLLMGGGLSGMAGGIYDFEISKVDAEGNIRFTKFYDFDYSDAATDGFETNDSCFIVCGYANTFTNMAYPAFIKIDQQGNEIWRKSQLSVLGGCGPRRMHSFPDGGFATIGTAGQANSYYARYLADGTMMYDRFPFGQVSVPDTTNAPVELKTYADGSFSCFYRVGYTSSTGNTVKALVQHYNVAGQIIGVTELSDNLGVTAWLNDKDGTLCKTSGYGYYKMNADSGYDQLATFETIRSDIFIYKYIETSDGGYLGYGYYTPDGSTTYPTFYVVKFSNSGDYKADDFSESVKAYPNPSLDGNITLHFDMTTDQTVNVKIFSADGKLVYMNEVFCPENSETNLPIRLDAGTTDAGLYFLEATTSKATFRQKLVVARTH